MSSNWQQGVVIVAGAGAEDLSYATSPAEIWRARTTSDSVYALEGNGWLVRCSKSPCGIDHLPVGTN